MAELQASVGVFHKESETSALTGLYRKVGDVYEAVEPVQSPWAGMWVLAFKAPTKREAQEWLAKQADPNHENWMIADGFIYPVLPAPAETVFYAPAVKA